MFVILGHEGADQHRDEPTAKPDEQSRKAFEQNNTGERMN
jgi:hypothetical protein